MPLGPLDPRGRENARITLEQVYVGLNAQTPLAVKVKGQTGQTGSVLAYAAGQKRLIILGDPGSGKSTFLRFLALRLAQARLEPEGDWLAYLTWPVYPKEQDRAALRLERDQEDKILVHMPWPHPAYVPVSVTLRDFAAADFDPASPLALWKFIEDDLTRRGLAQTLEVVKTQLEAGQGIFLLDGVDEVPPGRRAQVWRAIGALAEGIFSRCRWIVTCRILSFDEAEAAAAGGANPITLADLTTPQIDAFITAWYTALVDAGEKSQDLAQSLTTQLQQAAAGPLQELACNPMLLTIMAVVQTYYGTLPDERAKLYQACVETLLLRWQQSKEAAVSEVPQTLADLGLKKEIIEPLLWEIGYEAHAGQAGRQQAADIPELRVMELAKKHLGDYSKAEAFVEYTERRAHLLLGRGGTTGRLFSFPHRTFQEYLAGCHLVRQPRFGSKAIPLAQTGERWREVLLLAAGDLLFNQKRPDLLCDALEKMLPPTRPLPGDTYGWQQTWRAGEMLAVIDLPRIEADEVGRDLLPRLCADLAALLTGGELTPLERAAAGQTLARLGDPRPGVGLTPLNPPVNGGKTEQAPPLQGEELGVRSDSPPPFAGEGLGVGAPHLLWCPVPAGEFVMGEGKEAHPVTLPAFEISQYPVTNAQFGAFVTANGYRQPRYWDAAKYWTKAGFKGRFDDEPRTQPYSFGHPFNLPNHPVVGVSWFEAVAFCHWLSEVLTTQSKIENRKSKIIVRLPSEAEWEKAARGPTPPRQYPWGDDFDKERCNTAESGLGTTTPVGMYPGGISPCGAFDMAGNVWEWCSTVWAEKAYPFKVQDEWTPNYLRTNVPRLLRGGAFNSNSYDARCASRLGVNPSYRYGRRGFRVVRPPSAASGL